MKKIIYLVISMRPKQWVKNFFVIAPLLFSKRMMDIAVTVRAFSAFGLFCMFASSAYLINDVIDSGIDREHPEKLKRPIAKGLLSSSLALTVSFIMFFAALAGSYFLDKRFLAAGASYWFLNILYTLYFKRVVIIDVICIALGFVLRVIAGGIAVAVFSSPWILTTTMFLSLFLGFAKRRGELSLAAKHPAGASRVVLKDYSTEIINQFLIISATASIMSYALFALSDYAFMRFGTHNLIYTVPFVIFGVFRYFYLIHFSDFYQNPTDALWRDKGLAADIIIWIICIILIIYR